jgi:hypothetical protein
LSRLKLDLIIICKQISEKNLNKPELTIWKLVKSNVAFCTTHNRKNNHHNVLGCIRIKVENVTPIHPSEFIMKQPFAHNEK